MISVECAASGVDPSVLQLAQGKDLMVGVIDVGTEEVETPATVADRIRAVLPYVAPDKLYPCTDCGMIPRSREAARGKMKALADGARIVRTETDKRTDRRHPESGSAKIAPGRIMHGTYTINGVTLHVEETGSGEPIIFVHEFGGDARSWQPQVEHFSRHYRCVVYNARGYPPSDVPEDETLYGQHLSTADLKGVLDALDIERAFVVGLSMGAYTGLMLTMQHPERVRALVFASGGSGAYPETRKQFLADTTAVAEKILQANSVEAAGISSGPSRVQLQNKNQTVWEQFAAHLSEHSAVGSAYTLRHVQAERPSLYDLTGLTSVRCDDADALGCRR